MVALILALSAAALCLWAYFRPRVDLADLSLSTRGLDWRAEYWRNTWYDLLALRCVSCGDWGGCGHHWFCGLCRECLGDAEVMGPEEDQP